MYNNNNNYELSDWLAIAYRDCQHAHSGSCEWKGQHSKSRVLGNKCLPQNVGVFSVVFVQGELLILHPTVHQGLVMKINIKCRFNFSFKEHKQIGPYACRKPENLRTERLLVADGSCQTETKGAGNTGACGRSLCWRSFCGRSLCARKGDPPIYHQNRQNQYQNQ